MLNNQKNVFINKNKLELDSTKMHRILKMDGSLIDINYVQKMSNQKLLEGYEFMVLSRQQDTYMSQLQRQGRILTFAPNFGEEALQISKSMNIQKEDWFVPAFRSNATMLHLGVPLKNQFLYWNGNEKGSQIPEKVNVLPINIPIGTQYSHAAGLAYAIKLKKKKNVVVTVIGNGGTAEGEFYEALNISSIHKWPVLFTVNNNKWAISTPNVLESGSKTIAIKAIAAGIPGIRVDGNDLLASYDVVNEAMKYIRNGNGPVLIEFVTWRQGPHTTSDDPAIYRTKEEELSNEKWEPFHRIEKYLFDKKILNKEKKEKIWDEKLKIIKQSFQESLKELDVSLDEVFDNNYQELTPNLQEQKEEAKSFYDGEKNV